MQKDMSGGIHHDCIRTGFYNEARLQRQRPLRFSLSSKVKHEFLTPQLNNGIGRLGHGVQH